jgi:pimeloyl-ACP methyl ester carboxylesterase
VPVLLIHGFASTASVNWVYPGWLKTLGEAGYRVIAMDNRGHGASDKPHDPKPIAPGSWLAIPIALLDHLGIEKPISSATPWARGFRCSLRSAIPIASARWCSAASASA